MLQQFFQLFVSSKSPSLNSDTLVSKFVYRFLLGYLVCCFLCVTFLAQNNGKMYCYSDTDRLSTHAAEYCSSQGVYLYADLSEEEAAKAKYKQISPGVRGTQHVLKPLFAGIHPETEKEPEKLYNFFYMYSPVYFIMLAASCYISRLFWRKSQGQLLPDIIGNLKHKKLVRSVNERNNLQNTRDIEDAARILLESIGQHRWYLIKYFISECINCIILVSQLIAITVICGVSYWWHGWRIFYYINVPYTDWPLNVAKEFPLVAKCDIKHYGPGGNEVKHGALCFLHYNNVVQLLFAIHWVLAIVLLVLCLISTYTFYNKLSDQGIWANKLTSVLYLSTRSPLHEFLRRLTPGTSFVILLLSKNLSPHVVTSILADFRMEINARGNEYNERLGGML